MKKILLAANDRLFAAASTRMALSLLLTAALATGLWVVTLPTARARNMTPTEMIEEGLPPGKTMRTATKPEFLSAVCAAVKKHRPEAPAITKVAVAAHPEYAGDIVATVLRCSPNVDCAFVGTIVRAAIQAAESEASVIDDAALAMAPDCADAIQSATEQGNLETGGFSEGPINQLPLPGSVGGGGSGIGQEQLILVCDNGTQRTVRESQLAAFLSSHPGAFVGVCQPTPTTNR